MQTQWRPGFGGATGLDYQGVEQAARWLGLSVDGKMLEKLQALEIAQLNRWAEERKAGEPEG